MRTLSQSEILKLFQTQIFREKKEAINYLKNLSFLTTLNIKGSIYYLSTKYELLTEITFNGIRYKIIFISNLNYQL